MNPINLADLSSLLQLAAGLCLAGAVIIQYHNNLFAPEEAYIEYARSVVSPFVSDKDAYEELQHAIAFLENIVFENKFAPTRTLDRLVGLNIISGSISTILIALPALHFLEQVPFYVAAIISIACFAPLVLSLLFVRRGYGKYSAEVSRGKSILREKISNGLASAPNHYVERDRPQAALVGSLRGSGATAAPHIER